MPTHLAQRCRHTPCAVALVPDGMERAQRNSSRNGRLDGLRFAGWRPFRDDERAVVTSSKGCAMGYRMTPRCGYARRVRSGPEVGPKGAEFDSPRALQRSAEQAVKLPQATAPTGRAVAASGKAPGPHIEKSVVSPNGERWASWPCDGQRAPLGLKVIYTVPGPGALPSGYSAALSVLIPLSLILRNHTGI
jgi:hypothetical protein